jgi:MORN repeat variant
MRAPLQKYPASKGKPFSELPIASQILPRITSRCSPPPAVPKLISDLIAALALLSLCACHPGQQPPSCPPGAKLMGAPPPNGSEVWCQSMVHGRPLKDGPLIVYNTTGGKMVEGNYHGGIQCGEWTLWYENGARASVDHYRGGVQDGVHTSWYANGQKALEGEYRKGMREGIWVQWDPSGLSSHTTVYKDGKVQNKQ